MMDRRASQSSSASFLTEQEGLESGPQKHSGLESYHLLASYPYQHTSFVQRLSLWGPQRALQCCTTLQTPTYRQVRHSLWRALIPSFLLPEGSSSSSSSERSSTLTALDGLRGIACLCVFNYHLLAVFTTVARQGWGINSDARWVTQLPILRLPWAGRTMVALFFALSGYVLSFKPLKLMQSRNFGALANSLASSVFRRAFRLWAPSIIVTFFVMMLAHAGIFVAGDLSHKDRTIFRGVRSQSPPYIVNFGDQLQDWLHSLSELTYLWTWDYRYCLYVTTTWTIPIEFKCSLTLYVTQLGLGRLRIWYRMLTVGLLILYCVVWARWEMALFFGGMLIAEVDLATGLYEQSPPSLLDQGIGEQQQPQRGSHRIIGMRRKLSRVVWWTMFLNGLYLASCPPVGAAKTPGFIFLMSITPTTFTAGEAYMFMVSIGVMMLVWPILHLPELQRPLNSRFAQYFGKISFAFYLSHSAILLSFGYRILAWVWSYTGTDTVPGYCLGFALAMLLVFPVVVWTADLVWKFVDRPCIRLTYWLESGMALPMSSSLGRCVGP